MERWLVKPTDSGACLSMQPTSQCIPSHHIHLAHLLEGRCAQLKLHPASTTQAECKPRRKLHGWRCCISLCCTSMRAAPCAVTPCKLQGIDKQRLGHTIHQEVCTVYCLLHLLWQYTQSMQHTQTTCVSSHPRQKTSMRRMRLPCAPAVCRQGKTPCWTDMLNVNSGKCGSCAAPHCPSHNPCKQQRPARHATRPASHLASNQRTV